MRFPRRIRMAEDGLPVRQMRMRSRRLEGGRVFAGLVGSNPATLPRTPYLGSFRPRFFYKAAVGRMLPDGRSPRNGHIPVAGLAAALHGNRHDQTAYLLVVDRLQRRSAWRAKSPNIPQRWSAEEPAVFAVALAGAFVSYLQGRACGVQTIGEHASPRRLQAKLFLILKRTHGGQHPEMMVQRGYAHSRDFREIFYPERLRIIRPDPADRFCRSVALLS